MSYDNQRVVIENRFATQFPTSYPTIPIEYDGTDFDESGVDTWVRLSIQETSSTQANLGITNVVERFEGFVQFDIITQKGTGMKLSNEIKEAVGRIYSRVQLSSSNGEITFKTPMDMGHIQIEEKIVSVLRVSFTRNTRY